MHQHFYVCFPAYFLRAFAGLSGENESWLNMEPRRRNVDWISDPNVKQQKTNQTIITIMRATRVARVMCGCLLHPMRRMIFRTGSDRGAVAFTSQAKHTRVRLEANRDHLSVRWFVFTPAQKVRTSDFLGLVRTKLGRCEYTLNEFLKQKNKCKKTL